MQLSARILTALAVLAFTVAVVAGSGVTNEVSAATGTIDALNVGACTTTNADDFSLDNCTQQRDAFYQQDGARGSDRGRHPYTRPTLTTPVPRPKRPVQSSPTVTC